LAGSMTAMPTPGHLVAATITQLRALVDGVADASVWSMSGQEAATALVEVTRLEAQVVELTARVAAHADEVGVGDHVGATSTAAWLAHSTRQTRPAAAGVVRLGHDLGSYDHVRTALAHGDLRLEQARVILHAIRRLPDDLDADLLVKAEQHLVAAAAEHDARTLVILGRRLLEVIAPELADEHERRLLEQEEAKAAQATRLTMSEDGHGKVHGRFTLPAFQAAMLKKMLLALSAPKHLAATHGAGVERRPSPERLGRAFADLIERVAAKDLPKVGGTDATIVVTIDFDTLTGRLHQAGVLDTGERISASQARRLACTAGIIPVVLGGDSEILDVGRKLRLFTQAQQVAMGIRDKECRTQGCDWPAWMCHAHHWKRWADGGFTDLDNGGLLCPDTTPAPTTPPTR
jgi:uncharacterized protein DUF222